MIIRDAQSVDRPYLATVQTASWQDAYTDIFPADYIGQPLAAAVDRRWREVEIEPGDVVLVADDGDIVGFITVWCHPDPYIDNLHVRPAHRSQGTGSRLMKVAAQRLLTLGHTSVKLTVLESNEAAIRFYERLGGVLTEPVRESLFGYPVDAIWVEWADIRAITAAA